MRYAIAIIIFVLVMAIVYVRLAPVDTKSIHVIPKVEEPGNYEAANGFAAARFITAPPEDLIVLLDTLILETPRTRRIAGLPDLNFVTYETRSALFGFPDYTNVTIEKGSLAPVLIMKGQARFGASDTGVNKARILAWIEKLGPLTINP